MRGSVNGVSGKVLKVLDSKLYWVEATKLLSRGQQGARLSLGGKGRSPKLDELRLLARKRESERHTHINCNGGQAQMGMTVGNLSAYLMPT